MAKKQFNKVFLALTVVLLVSPALAENHSHKHANFAPDVDGFHAILAPIWHAPQGKERLANACRQVVGMEKKAGEIRSADATALVASVASLKSRCDARPDDVEGALSDVHEAFHRLIDARH